MSGALILTATEIECAVQLPRYLSHLSLLSEHMLAVPGHTEEEIDGQSQNLRPLFEYINAFQTTTGQCSK